MPTARRSGTHNAQAYEAPSPRTHVDETDLSGLFMWLPHRRTLSVHDYATDKLGGSIDPMAYGHPVVCLYSKTAADGTVVVLGVTSLGGRTFADRFADIQNPRQRRQLARQYVPIAPSPAHSPHLMILRTAGGLQLAKDSYVRTHLQIRVRLDILQRYGERFPGAWAERLSRASCRTLKAYVSGFEEDVGRVAMCHAVQESPAAANAAASGTKTPLVRLQGHSAYGGSASCCNINTGKTNVSYPQTLLYGTLRNPATSDAVSSLREPSSLPTHNRHHSRQGGRGDRPGSCLVAAALLCVLATTVGSILWILVSW